MERKKQGRKGVKGLHVLAAAPAFCRHKDLSSFIIIAAQLAGFLLLTDAGPSFDLRRLHQACDPPPALLI